MADGSYSEPLFATVILRTSDFRKDLASADAAIDEFAAGMKWKKKGEAGSFSFVGEELIAAGNDALSDFAEKVMAQSRVEVPKDTLTLLNSWAIWGPSHDSRGSQVEMGYGFSDEPNPKTGRLASQYAIPVHEIEANHPEGKAFYLIDPLLDQAFDFPFSISASMKMVTSRTYSFLAKGRRHGFGPTKGGVIEADIPSLGGGLTIRGGNPANRGWFSGATKP